jgi:TRAP-type transport system periplasmic protein
MKKKRKILGVVFAGLLFFSISSVLTAGDKVVLKIGTLAPEGSTWTKAFRDISQELEQKTGRQVSLRVFPGGIQGDEEDMLRKIKVGQLQGGFFTGGGLGLIFKDIKILSIPFLFENYNEVDAVMAKMSGYLEKGFWDNGYKIMDWGENGFIYLLSREPIKSAADLKKGKVWIWEDTAIGKAVFREVGVNPVPLGIPDVLMSLQTGMIDTVYASPLAAISMQWFTRVSYLTNLPLSYSVGALVLQKTALDKIPSAQRALVEEIFKRHLEPMKALVRQENQKALGVMAKQGIKTVTPAAKDTKELRASVFKAMDTLGEEQFSKKTFEEIKAFLKTMRKEN